jgi:hypothetical protein
MKMKKQDFILAVSQGGLVEAKRILRKYITDGQPDNFLPGYTTRAMCRLAGCILDGVPLSKEYSCSYLDTKHGWELYSHMWGIGE